MSLQKKAHAFKSEHIAEALVEVGKREMAGTSGRGAPTGREVRVVKTPSGGISAATIVGGEAELTYAVCEIKYTGVDLVTPITKSTLLSDGATTAKIKVWNYTSNDIGGNEFILAARHGNVWVAVSGGGGSDIKTMKSTSEITARSGDTAGTGTAVSYESYDGVTYTLGTEDPPYDIINPYAQTVSNGIVIQCRQAAAGKWELIQAECEDTTATDSGDSGGGDSGGGDSGGGPPSPGGL